MYSIKATWSLNLLGLAPVEAESAKGLIIGIDGAANDACVCVSGDYKGGEDDWRCDTYWRVSLPSLVDRSALLDW